MMKAVVVEKPEVVRVAESGDRVAVDPSRFCGECYYCRKLQGNHCVNWGSMALNYTFNQAIALLQAGALDVRSLVSHELPRDDFTAALALAGTAESVKVQIAPEL